MGLLSKITGAVKNIFSGVKKAWKSVTGSTLGKALLIGAAIYFGYMAFQPGGAFAAASPASGELAGAALETGTAATEAGTALTANEAALAETATSGAVESGAGMGSTAGGAAPAITPGTESLGNIPVNTELASNYGAQNAAGKSLIEQGVKQAATTPSWWEKLPEMAKYGMITAGAGAIQGAFTPNAMDVAEKQAQLQREEEQRRYDLAQQNLAVGSVSTGFRPAVRPPGQPVRPTGIINYR